jgi:hypothetical protein
MARVSIGGDGSTIEGGTDGTAIGNVSDALKVTGTISTSMTDKATYTAWAIDVATANNKSMISIQNTTGSTVTVRVQKIHLINSQTSAVTGVITDFRLLRAVSHASGTTVTPGVHQTATALNSSVTVQTGATITTEDTAILGRWKYSNDEWGSGSADVESFDHATNSTSPVFSADRNSSPIVLIANQCLTLKCVTSTTVGTFDICVVFTTE